MTLKEMQVRQMIALDYTLFPFTFHEIVNSLEKIGFEITPSIPTPIPYGRFNGTGQVGRKGKTVCVLNTSQQSMQMVGNSLESTTDELNEVLATILDSYKIDLHQRVNWYEFQAHYEYKTKKNPVKMINTKFNSPINQEITKIFDVKVKSLVARLGLENKYPNQVEWFDIKISPDFQRNDGYVIEIIYRTANKETYQSFLANVEKNIDKVIKQVEG